MARFDRLSGVQQTTQFIQALRRQYQRWGWQKNKLASRLKLSLVKMRISTAAGLRTFATKDKKA